MGGLVQLGGVEETTNRDLDTLAEGLGVAETKDTGIVHLGLDKGIAVEVELGTNFEVNGGLGSRVSCLRVPGCLGTSLEISIDTVVVRCGEDLERVVGMESNRVLGSGVASNSGKAGDVGTGKVIGDLTSSNETLTADNNIGGDGGALEDIQVGARVDTELLVQNTDLGALLALMGVETSCDIQLQALGNLVLDLNLGGEVVVGGPGLGDSQAILVVDVLGLELTADVAGLGILVTEDVEGHTVGSDGLELELGVADGVVLSEQVIGGLAEISKGDGNSGGHD